MRNTFLIHLIFWLHLPIVLLWFGLFLLPPSVWPGVVSFHFWYIASIMALQFLWGLVFLKWTHQLDIICPLTTLLQWLRGYPLPSRKNYGHSYIAELLGMLGWRVHYGWVNTILLITLGLIVVRYFWQIW
ncbi:MAG: hypothetical protein AABX13_06415 [Nanoarchaeota archaeon]